MKKVIGKTLSAALAVAMAVSIAACGSGNQSDSSSSSTASGSSTATTSSTAAKEPVKLSMWHIQTTEPVTSYIKESMDRFTKDNPNYTVDVQAMQNDAYKTKIAVAMSSNSAPDIFFSWTGGTMNQYVDAGKLADLTPYMTEGDYKSKFMDAAISQATYKDKIWAVPVENTSVAMFFYNKDVFAKYNLQVPKTTKELEAICETLKKNGVIPFSLANKTQWTGSMYYMYLVDRVGGADPFKNAAGRTGSFEDPAFTQAGQIIQDWVKKDYFNKGFNGLDEDSGQSRTLLYSGKAAMTLMGSWFLSTVAGENKDFISKVGSFPFPAVEGGKGDPNAVVGTVGDNFYHVSATSKDPAGAFKAITYMLDETAVKERIEAGRIPPLKETKVSDANLQAVLDSVQKAPYVQLWYDQYLPPELGDLHKSTSQAIFGLSKTPEQVNKEMEAKAKEVLK
jgi:raffinose/stachyose/melibiose transport system substrate-binding protein